MSFELLQPVRLNVPQFVVFIILVNAKWATGGRRISKHSRIICNGFVYHTSVLRRNPPVRYLRCSKYASSRCHGRAVLPLNESVDRLRITQPHNHPPDNTSEEKFSFKKKLKCAVQNAPNTSFKKVFDSVAELEPKISKQFTYGSLRSSMLICKVERACEIKRKPDMPRYIVDGFVFHVNIMKGNPPMTYLRCMEYKRLGCHARAVIPCNGTVQDIQLKKPHNHPPDYIAEEKILFMRELKDVMLQNKTLSSREVYDILSPIYPNAARETTFESIRGKMNRWRRTSEQVHSGSLIIIKDSSP